MITVQAKQGEILDLGKRGENQVRRIAFDLTDFIVSFGEGTPQLTVTRPMETCAYAAMLTREDGTVYWDIGREWTACCGIGACQLSWYVGETLAKSEIYSFRVSDSLDEGEGAPEPAQVYLEQVQQFAVRAEEAAGQVGDAVKSAGAFESSAKTAAEESASSAASANDSATAAGKFAGMAEQSATAAEAAAETAAKQVELLGMSRNTVANALKGTAQGASVTLDDVSPLEHPVSVKVQSKNLVDYSKISGYNSDTVSVDGNVVTIAAGNNGWGLILSGVRDFLEVGKAYTFSFASLTGLDTTTYKGYGFEIKYKDNTGPSLSGYIVGTAPLTITIKKEVYALYFRTGWGADIDEDIVITGIQIEEGSAATEYTPFVPVTGVTLTATDPDGTQTVTYTPTEDGSCEVASIAPAMTLTTDNENVRISCEYNRDINKAYDQLVQAILSLGGNI